MWSPAAPPSWSRILTGEFYNPLTEQVETIKGKYTQFQKIVIKQGQSIPDHRRSITQ
jgi:hypothetical protein